MTDARMTDAELVMLRDDLARRWGEEIAQEVIVHFLTKQSTVADPRAWCYGAARHLLRERRRYLQGHLPLPPTEELQEGDTEPTLIEALQQPADQLARLEAAEDLALAPSCLVAEAEGRRRLTHQRRSQARRQFRRRLAAREGKPRNG